MESNSKYKTSFLATGFSLAEVVISIGIFSIASVIISAVYLNANTLHQNTANLQRLQNDGRYIIEKIAREIRAREIEYPLSESQPQDNIQFLPDENNEDLEIRYLNGNIEYIINGLNANLNGDDVEVVEAKFYITPLTKDIWGDEPLSNFQPKVTILLKIKNKVANPKYEREVVLQTTVSSKVYSR